MEFTWDSCKAAKNIVKHKVSFFEARTVFNDPDAIRIFDPDHSEAEDRFILLGISARLRLLVVCHCYRGLESIRIISARKATRREKEAYLERIDARGI